jgi:hypothetical protein
LPVLEAMLDSNGEAYAQGGQPPKRFILCFAGMGVGAERGGVFPSQYNIPAGAGGATYDVTGKVGLEPLAGVKSEVSVVSGLRIPTSPAGSTPPPGGWTGVFHSNARFPLLTGIRCSPTLNTSAAGPSADHLAARAIEKGQQTPLAMRVQYLSYELSNRSSGGGAQMSYVAGSTGRISPNPPSFSPRVLFDSLFKSLPATAGGSSSAVQIADQRRRRRMMDTVLAHAERLKSRLGRADQLHIDRHMVALTELERLIKDPPSFGPGCVRPPDPGADPAAGTVVVYRDAQGTLKDRLEEGVREDNLGWSDEDRRADFMTEALRTMMACDARRTATLMYTWFQSAMNMMKPTGNAVTAHGTTHSTGNGMRNAKAVGWHVGHFAKLVDALKRTPEAGGSVLDHTVLLLIFEGGFGASPELAGGATRGNTSHSTENMFALVAGGRKLGLAPGRHVALSGAGKTEDAIAMAKHPVNVMVSALDAIGAFAGGKPKQLGEISGTIPGLFA